MQTWVAPFLEMLRKTGNVSASARAVGITTNPVSDKRKKDADFAAAFDEAMEEHTDACEAELTRRAFGYDELVVYQGQLTPVFERDERGRVVLDEDGNPVQERNEDGSLKHLTVRKHSDALLLAKTKAYRKRYATERTELTGADGGPVDSRQIVICTGVPRANDFSDLA